MALDPLEWQEYKTCPRVPTERYDLQQVNKRVS
jgi:hypothetical protein